MCRISRSTPVDLIFVLGWVTHIERMWDQSRIERFLRRLSSFARVLTPWISGVADLFSLSARHRDTWHVTTPFQEMWVLASD